MAVTIGTRRVIFGALSIRIPLTYNAIPTRSEIWTSAALTAKLYSLEKRGALLRDALKLHQEEEKRVLIRKNTVQNSSVAMVALPAELTVRILEYVRDDGTENNPIILVSVCHAWMELVLGGLGKTLWTRLTVSMAQPVDVTCRRMNHFLTRSRPRPLGLEIRDDAPTDSDAGEVLHIIKSNATLWRTLLLRSSFGGQLLPLGDVFDNLRALRLRPSKKPQIPQVLAPSSFPSMRSLRFEDSKKSLGRISTFLDNHPIAARCTQLSVSSLCDTANVERVIGYLPNLRLLTWNSKPCIGLPPKCPFPPGLDALWITGFDPLACLPFDGGPDAPRMNASGLKHLELTARDSPGRSLAPPLFSARNANITPHLQRLAINKVDATNICLDAAFTSPSSLLSIACISPLDNLSNMLRTFSMRILEVEDVRSHSELSGEDIKDHRPPLLYLNVPPSVYQTSEGWSEDQAAEFVDVLRGLAAMKEARRHALNPDFRIRCYVRLVLRIPALARAIAQFPDLLEAGRNPAPFPSVASSDCVLAFE